MRPSTSLSSSQSSGGDFTRVRFAVRSGIAPRFDHEDRSPSVRGYARPCSATTSANCSATASRPITAGQCSRITTRNGCGARRVLDLGCGAGDSVDLFRSVDPERELGGRRTSSESPEVAGRTRADAEFVTFDGRRLPVRRRQLRARLLQAGARARRAPARAGRRGGTRAGSRAATSPARPRSSRPSTRAARSTGRRTASRSIAEDAGLEVVELRPVIDGFTLVAWRALGLPRLLPPLVGARVAALPGDRARRARARGSTRARATRSSSCSPGSSHSWPAGRSLGPAVRPVLIALAAALALPAAAAAAEPQWRVHAEASGSYRLDYGSEHDPSTARPAAAGRGR